MSAREISQIYYVITHAHTHMHTAYTHTHYIYTNLCTYIYIHAYPKHDYKEEEKSGVCGIREKGAI